MVYIDKKNATLTHPLQVHQSRPAKVILNKDYFSSASYTFEELDSWIHVHNDVLLTITSFANVLVTATSTRNYCFVKNQEFCQCVNEKT